MSKSWDDLPNAQLIDWVLQSLKDKPKLWTAACHAGRVAAWSVARVAAWDAARDAARNAIWIAAWDAARKWTNAAWNAATCAISALLAWDDSAQFLDMTSDELEVWARLSNDPRAIMLLPAVRAFERIKALETA